MLSKILSEILFSGACIALYCGSANAQTTAAPAPAPTTVVAAAPVCCAPVYSTALQYYYDQAGNRYQRRIDLICISNCFTDGGGNSRTTASTDPNSNSLPPEKQAEKQAAVFADEHFGAGVRLYPNPVTSILTIDLAATEIVAPALLYLYDTDGRLIQTQNLTQGISNTLDMSALVSGMYIVRLVQADAVSDWKVVKN